MHFRWSFCPLNTGNIRYKNERHTYKDYLREFGSNDDWDEAYDEDDGERLSVYDAAQIWASHGKDKDYTFGYSEEELEEAL
jgi:hypothetical protein